MGVGGGSPETDVPTESETKTPTKTQSPTTRPAPNMDFRIQRVPDGSVKVVHMEGKQVEDDVTEKVIVTVNGEQVPMVDEHGTEHDYFVADDTALGGDETAATPYPISVGNRVFVDAPANATVAVVWFGEGGRTKTLEEKTIE
jgi:hypothetical protein